MDFMAPVGFDWLSIFMESKPVNGSEKTSVYKCLPPPDINLVGVHRILLWKTSEALEINLLTTIII